MAWGLASDRHGHSFTNSLTRGTYTCAHGNARAGCRTCIAVVYVYAITDTYPASVAHADRYTFTHKHTIAYTCTAVAHALAIPPTSTDGNADIPYTCSHATISVKAGSR